MKSILEEQTRANFIKNSSKIIATITGILTFGKYIFIVNNNEVSNKSLNVNEKSNPSDTDKTLIVYDSKFGSTSEIALFIKNSMPNNSIVDIKKITEVSKIDQYSNVIIGSAIQYDKWMPDARHFIKENEHLLSTKNVSCFLVCLVLTKKTEKAKIKAINYASKVKDLVPKVTINNFGKFAGVLNYSKMSFGQKILAKGIFAVIGIKEGDYRDWNKIKEWAEKL